MYYFLDKNYTESVDALPSSLTIVGFPSTIPYALCYFSDDLPALPYLKLVSRALYRLLVSAERYPPALALTQAHFERQTISQNSKSSALIYETLDQHLQQQLRKHLKQQPFAPYVLVEALIDEPGYLMRGAYYWVINYNENDGTVLWIADDYTIYENRSTNFDIGAVNLALLVSNTESIDDYQV